MVEIQHTSLDDLVLEVAYGRTGIPSVSLHDFSPDALEGVTYEPCLRIVTQGHR